MGSPIYTNSARGRLSLQEYVSGIRNRDRVILSRGITLVESGLEADQLLAEELVEQLLPFTGHAHRIGITGIPGVGKSTFINTFGEYLIQQGKKVAVLAIDPSSQISRGSILGDKTRMDELSRNEASFIRPTATGNVMGGISSKTKEALLLCEAAGYDVILVETVGVGQSEVAVREVVDFFVLLLIGGAGDELQGIKKGIMEMADALIVTKADGENLPRARQAVTDYSHALHMLPPSASGWTPEVILTSAVEHTGLQESWQVVERYFEHVQANGFLKDLRNQQNLRSLRQALEWFMQNEITNNSVLQRSLKDFEAKILSGQMTSARAARQLWKEFKIRS